MHAALRRTSHQFLDWIYPPQDMLPGRLGNTWTEISFLDDPCCHACGFPFDYDQGAGVLCGRCAARRPVYHQARSGLRYDDASRPLILGFKHGGRTENLNMFSRHMKRAGRRFWDQADYILPVPLHPSRLIHRRFNQAAILARRLARDVDIVFNPHILLRQRKTPSQGLQTAKGRFRNVRGAFTVSARHAGLLAGKSVVLVDDVFTTGATVEACARTLKRAGTHRVNVVTLARVVRAQPIPT